MGKEETKQVFGNEVPVNCENVLDDKTLVNQDESISDDIKRSLFSLIQCCTNASLPAVKHSYEDLFDMTMLLYCVGNNHV